MWYSLLNKEGEIIKGIQGKSLAQIEEVAKQILNEVGLQVGYLNKQNCGYGSDYGRRSIYKMHRVNIKL